MVFGFICGIFVGIDKTGVSDLAMLSVPILGAIFGGKPSVGLLLHMLCIWAIFWIPAFAGMTFFELFLI